MTTPEQLTLLLSHPDSAELFADLDTIVLDEIHALAATKRGDLLSLSLARLRKLAPGMRTVGLSATVARPSELRAYLVPQHAPQSHIDMADLVHIVGGAKPQIDILELDETMPTVGHTTRYAIGEIYAAIEAHRLCLLFVNTRMQAELLFQDLWRINDLGLPIALHHGSLDAAQRRKVEAAMAEGSLRAVVATSTLDLGIDWGDVDLVIHVGAPKGASRFIQRIGRSNHRLDEPSQAMLVPSNRFEVLECRAAVDAAEAGEQDVTFSRQGALDVLAQHILGTACAGDFDAVRALRRGNLGGAVRAAAARHVRPRARLRRRRRLRAQIIRTLRQAQAGAGRQAAHCTSALHPGLPHERRHHRCRADDQGAPRRPPRRRYPQGDDRRRASWARSTNTSSSSCAPAMRSCSPARYCASRA